MRTQATVLVLCLLLLAVGLSAVMGPTGVALASPDGEAKQKVVYFQNATLDIGGSDEFVMNTLLPTTEEVVEEFQDASLTFSWFMDPPLAGDLVLDGSASARVWIRLLDAKGEGTAEVRMGLGLYAHPEGGPSVTILDETAAANQKAHPFVTSHFSEYDVSATVGEVTVDAGARLEVRILLDSNDAVTKRIAWGSEDFRSRAELPAVTRTAVDAVRALNETGGQPPFFEEDDEVTFNATVVSPFGGYDIVWVNLTLQAPDGTLLFDREPMVQTTGNDTSYASTFELAWPDTPKTRGSYNVTVEVVDRTGFHFRFPDRPGDETYGGHLEALTVLLSVGEIVWANFQLQDAMDVALAGARLELWDGTALAAAGTSNATGGLNLTTLPGPGEYTARGYWEDHLVLETTVDLPGFVNEDEAILLVYGVYHPTLRVVDDGGVPLGEATLFVTHPNGTVLDAPLVTDSQGEVALAQVAGGTYLFRVIWSGVDVGVKGVVIGSNDVHVVVGDVFYLRVQALDQAGERVTGVHVTVTDEARALIADSKLTDAEGEVLSRLPTGTYRVEANWLGADVGLQEGVDLTANRTLELTLAIFGVELTLVDQEGVPLEGATVEVAFQDFKAGGLTDGDGRLSLQLPGGEVSFQVWWRDVLVFDDARSVDEENIALTVVAEVYHVPVRALDKDGNPIPGVALTLYRNGVAVDGGITGADGTFTFRQPVGSYRVEAKLDTTYLLTDVDLSAETNFAVPQDAAVEIRFVEFAPALTSTNLFYVLLVVGALLGALAFFVFRWRGGGGGAPEIEIPEPPEP